MGNNQENEENSSTEINKEGRNWNPNKKLDTDPNMSGPFSYSENQENESIHTIPDERLNPASRDVEGPSNNDNKARDNSGYKDRQKD
jgi:hypothetical protein